MADHGSGSTWASRENLDYPTIRDRTAYAMDHYSSDLLNPDLLNVYLHRHSQGESADAYEERKKVSKYKPHFAFAVDSLAGQLFAKEKETQRSTSDEENESPDSLGTLEDEDSIMGRIKQDADGAGANYLNVWTELAPRLIANRSWWVLAVGPETDEAGTVTKEARIRLVDPRLVTDWIEVAGRVVEVKVREEYDTRSSVKEEQKIKVRWVVYDLEGWTKYDEKGEPAKDEDGLPMEGSYEYWTTKAKTERCLPIARISIPIKRDLGYTMAKIANGLFNLESTRDFRLWTACINRLHVRTAGDVEAVRKNIKDGDSMITTQGPDGLAEYFNPSQEPALASSKILTQEIEEFYTTFFRGYANAAREVTATEIMQDVQAGVQAFLVLLAVALDEAENFVLKIWEQSYFADRSEVWGATSVERPKNYQAVDISALADGLSNRYFGGKPVPVGKAGTLAAANKIADLDGLETEPDEVEKAVDEFLLEPAEDGGILSRRTARVLEGTREETDRLPQRVLLANAGRRAALPQ